MPRTASSLPRCSGCCSARSIPVTRRSAVARAAVALLVAAPVLAGCAKTASDPPGSGEPTSTMIHGGICRYPAGSQLAQAAGFLRSHRGSTALVTIDIGANDPNSCVIGARPATIIPCLVSRIPRIERNLTAILATLRSAAGRRVLIVGMTYYVPELGLWRTGRTGREIGMVIDGFAAGVNRLMTKRYHRVGARVADVFAAFRSTDFGAGRPNAGRASPVPPNVTVICSLTWMCAAPPRGPNEHANDAGYRIIARSFWRAIAG